MSYLGVHPDAGDMVDHHTAHVQLLKSEPCLVQVMREYSSLQPVLAVVHTACMPGQIRRAAKQRQRKHYARISHPRTALHAQDMSLLISLNSYLSEQSLEEAWDAPVDGVSENGIALQDEHGPKDLTAH